RGGRGRTDGRWHTMSATSVTSGRAARAGRLGGMGRWVAGNGRLILAFIILAVLLAIYIERVPQFGAREQRSVVNQGLALTTTGFGQTVVVLTGGIDLSVGS